MPVIDFNHAKPQAKKERDFKALAQHAAPRGLEILSRWLPGGKVVGREYVCATTKGGSGTSCSTNIATGKGSDFASGEKWGDYVALVATAEGVRNAEAAEILEDFLGIEEWTPPPPPVVQETEEEGHARAKAEALALYNASAPASPMHPYLARKGIPALPDVRVDAQGRLLIPMNGQDGFRTVQIIKADGQKRNVTGANLKGSFHYIDGDRKRIYLCEGYATAVSVAQATGAMAIHAYNCDNLPIVASFIASEFPASEIIVAGDNDEAGHKAGAKAKKLVPRIREVYPPKPGDDWNDHAAAHGIESVRSLLSAKNEDILVDLTTVEVVEPEYLIEDAVETPCTGAIIGASGTGKTFFALDLAFHVAAGRPWLGKKVKEGAVIYAAGEGRHGLPRRLKAWEAKHGKLPAGKLYSAKRTVTFDEEGAAQLVAELDRLTEQVKPVAIFIDTLARALPPNSDENSAKDMGCFINVVDAVKDRYKCAVLILHHTGWSEGAQKRGRGSSAIKGALDLEILLADGVIEWVKTKDMEPHPAIAYKRDKIVYGDNPRDNSCVISYDLDYDPQAVKMTATQKDGMAAFEAACKKTGGVSTNLDTWRDEFYAIHGGTATGNRQAFHRVKKDLLGMGHMDENEGVFTAKKRSSVDRQIENAMFGNLIKTSKS